MLSFFENLQSGKPEDREDIPKETVNLINALRAARLTKEEVTGEAAKVFGKSRRQLSVEDATDLAETSFEFLAKIAEGIPTQTKSK